MLLKLGSEGDDVRKLQAKLGIEAIGKFGPKTDAAVKAWQSAHGLTADGIVGDGTWGKLFGVATPVNPQITDAVTASKPNTSGLKLDKLKSWSVKLIC